MKKILLLVLGLSFSGCATQPGYKQTLDNWVGRDADELITVWGSPHDTYQDEHGDIVYWYLSERTMALPAATASGGLSGVGARSLKLTCNTWLWLDSDNRITRWQLNGNYCDEAFVANSLKPTLAPRPETK